MMVSVVVVSYNQESIIMETLDSIYNQTYSPLELIISDDGSKDGTVRVAEGWIEEHRDRFINTQVLKSEKNRGTTRNCNRGLFAAKGEYAQLIAADDVLMKNAIEEKVAFAEETGQKCVFCRTQLFGPAAARTERMQAFCERGYSIIKKGYNEQLDEILCDNYIAGPSGGFYKLSFFKEFGGFDERYPMLEDYPFIFHYLMAGNEIILLDKVLSGYRMTETSVGGSGFYNPSRDCHIRFFFKERLLALLKRKKIRIAAYQFCKFTYLGIRIGIHRLLENKPR